MNNLIPNNVNNSNVLKDTEIHELSLYAINTSYLYNNYFSSIQHNLYRNFLKNEYVPELAQKSILNILSIVERQYVKEFCTKEFKFNFNTDEKKELANVILSHYVMDFELYPNGGYLIGM